MPDAFVTRFAPSPTGFLHLGHAFSALTAFGAAQRAGGTLALRIEDIDQTRCRPEFEAAIYEDLRWLGVDWAEPVRRQSDHMAEYRAALDALIARGLCYRCFKTRTEILGDIARAPHLAPSGPEGPAYVGAPLDAEEERMLLAEGAPFAWRLSLARAEAALDYVAAKLEVTRATAVEYLVEYIREEKPAGIFCWVPEDVCERVAAAAEQCGTARLKPAFLALNEEVPYDTIRVVFAFLDTRDGR